MKRKIVHIDESKCDGCGQCITACHEGALKLVDGVAKLVSDVYCDGLGDCLGECPRGAITIEEREADPFDQAAVEQRLAEQQQPAGCPGMAARQFAQPAHEQGKTEKKRPTGCPGAAARQFANRAAPEPENAGEQGHRPSQLGHWPIQLKLVPPAAPFLKGADLVIAADCTAYALSDMHERYLADRAVLIGCPKLDDIAFYRDKLAAIFAEAAPRSITVLRMEVPCCAAIARAAVDARDSAAPDIPIEVHTVTVRGQVTRESVPAP